MSFKDKLSNATATFKVKVDKNAPTIMTVVGVVGVVGTVVLAIRATLKSIETIEEHNALHFELEDWKSTVKEKAEKGELDPEKAEEIQETFKKETVQLYFKTGKKLARQYAPVALLGTFSIGMLIGSHKILNGRFAGMVAAYAGLDKTFKNYRGRVVDRYGEEVDGELLFGTHTEYVKTVEKDEDGKTKKVKLTREVINEEEMDVENLYVRYITRKNFDLWDDDPDIVRSLVMQRMSIANGWLEARHAVVFNDVLRLCGFTPTKAGMVVGWLYKPNDQMRDNHILFGPVKEVDGQKTLGLETVNVFMKDTGEYETAYKLCFNVDGSIYDNFEETIVHECE